MQSERGSDNEAVLMNGMFGEDDLSQLEDWKWPNIGNRDRQYLKKALDAYA